jgi:hypothetical protein
MVIPLYPKFPLIRIPDTYVAIRLEYFVLVVSAIVLLYIYRDNLSWFVKGRFKIAIIIFLLVSLLSVISGNLLTKTVVLHISLFHWIRRIEYFVPFFLALHLIKKDAQSIKLIMKVLLLLVVVLFIYGFGQRYFSWPIFITQNMEYAKGLALRWIPGSHINSTFAGHYDLATFLVMTLPVIIALFALTKNLKARIVIFLVFLSGLWLLVSAISRISVVSYLLASTLTLLIIRKYKYIPLIIIISLLFFGQSFDLISRYSRIIQFGKNKIEKVITIPINTEVYAKETQPEKSIMSAATSVVEDRSMSIRLNVEWPRAIRAFLKNPLLGSGYSSITLATDNDYLRMLGEVGLLGFASFFLIFLYLAKAAKELMPIGKYFSGVELAFVSGFIGSIPGIMVNAIFIDVFEASKFAILFWLLFGLAIGLMKKRKRKYE